MFLKKKCAYNYSTTNHQVLSFPLSDGDKYHQSNLPAWLVHPHKTFLVPPNQFVFVCG